MRTHGHDMAIFGDGNGEGECTGVGLHSAIFCHPRSIPTDGTVITASVDAEPW